MPSNEHYREKTDEGISLKEGTPEETKCAAGSLAPAQAQAANHGLQPKPENNFKQTPGNLKPKKTLSSTTKLLLFGSAVLATNLFWCNAQQVLSNWALADPNCQQVVRSLFASDVAVSDAQKKALALMQQHNFVEAEKTLEAVIDRPSVLRKQASAYLMSIYALDSKSDQAEKVAIRMANGNEHEAALNMHLTACPVLIAGNNPQLARPMLQRAANTFKRLGGDRDKFYIRDLFFLARCDAAEGKLAKAIEKYKQVLPLLKETWGPSSEYTISAEGELAQALQLTNPES